jgi:hypothetical protein
MTAWRKLCNIVSGEEVDSMELVLEIILMGLAVAFLVALTELIKIIKRKK